MTEVTCDPVGSLVSLPGDVLSPARGSAPRRSGPGPAQAGRRLAVEERGGGGLFVRARRPKGPLRDLAILDTLLAAARRRSCPMEEGAVSGDRAMSSWIQAEDLREKIRVRRQRASLAFLVDASGSMRRGHRMVATKGAVLTLLTSAYTSRDRVALAAFRGQGAEVLLPYTASVERARRALEALPAGGRTPLGEGLRLGLAMATEERRRHPGSTPLLVVISDGRPNWSRGGDPEAEVEALAWRIGRARLPLLFLDTDPTWQEPGMGQTIARLARGRYLALAELSAQAIFSAVSQARTRSGSGHNTSHFRHAGKCDVL